MTSLVLELRKEALDSTVSTLNLLRKASVVATKLKLQEFKNWIDSEINGYANGQKEPEYRRVIGEVKYLNPYRGYQPITFDFPSKISESMRSRYLYQPISELERLVIDSSHNNLIVKYGADIEIKIQRFFSLDSNVQPTLHITKASVHRILEAVRDTILQWSLRLEEDGILGEEMSFSSQEKQVASEHKYINLIEIRMEQSQLHQNSEQFVSQINQNFSAPVGAVQNGDGNTANTTQNFGGEMAEILKAITDLRDQVNTLSVDRQSVANGAIADLETAVSNPSLPEKAKSALWILWGVGQGVVSFLDPLTAIAERFGVHFHN